MEGVVTGSFSSSNLNSSVMWGANLWLCILREDDFFLSLPESSPKHKQNKNFRFLYQKIQIAKVQCQLMGRSVKMFIGHVVIDNLSMSIAEAKKSPI